MMNKISPHPSLSKRGKKEKSLCQRGEKKRNLFVKGGKVEEYLHQRTGEKRKK